MSDDIEEDGINVIIDFTQKISVVRFLNGAFIPSQLTIKTEVLPMEGVEEIDFDVVFSKIKYWFDVIVASSVIYCQRNKIATEMFIGKEGYPQVNNHIMMAPYEPTDEHLAVLFQSKMTALSGGKMLFGYVRVKSDTARGLTFTYVGDWENDLPDMEEWFNIKPYYFDKPWWCRDDISSIDLMVGDDISEIPPWATKLDFIENAIRPKKDISEEEVVVRFKPKIIDGGKNEDN